MADKPLAQKQQNHFEIVEPFIRIPLSGILIKCLSLRSQRLCGEIVFGHECCVDHHVPKLQPGLGLLSKLSIIPSTARSNFRAALFKLSRMSETACLSS